MNPTLSERLEARRHDPYWRSHPPTPWGVPLETPVALQVLQVPTSEPVTTRRQEWVLLLAIALVWLWEGLEALLQILRRWRPATEFSGLQRLRFPRRYQGYGLQAKAALLSR